MNIPPFNSPLPAILYGRFSDDKQDMERQERMFADYVTRNNIEVELTIFDPATSGSIPMMLRENGKLLLAEAEQRAAQGRPLAVITTEQDRLGRDTFDIIGTVRRIWDSGAVPHFIAEGGPLPRNPENQLKMEIRASVAQYELNKIKQRVRDKMAGKRTAGELCGSLTYGWNVEYHFANGDVQLVCDRPLNQVERAAAEAARGPLLKQIVVENLDELQWVRHIDIMHRGGATLSAIAKDLNARRVPTKMGVQLLKLRCAPGDRGAIKSGKGYIVEKLSKGIWQVGNVEHVLNNATVKAWLATQ